MKQSKTGTKIAILLLASCQGSLAIAVTAIETLSGVYPDVAQGTLLLISTLPTLAAILASVCSAAFYKMLGYKNTGIMAVLMVGLGGAIPLVIPGIAAILISRVILGIGYGISAVLAPTLIGIKLAGDKNQKNFYGYEVAMLGMSGVIFGQIGGILTGINVKMMWALHLVFLLVLVIIIAGLEEPTEQELAVQSAADGAKEKHDKAVGNILHAIPSIFFLLIILHFAASSVSMTWYSNVSYVTAERGILNAAAFAGTMMAVYNLGNFVGGLMTGRFSMLTKHYTVIVGITFFAVCYFLTCISGNKLIMLLAAMILGMGDAIAYSSAFTIVGYLVKGESNGLAVGVMNAFTQGGCFVGPYIPLMISTAMGGDGAALPQMRISVVLAVVLAVVYFVVLRLKACKPIAEGYASNV